MLLRAPHSLSFLTDAGGDVAMGSAQSPASPAPSGLGTATPHWPVRRRRPGTPADPPPVRPPWHRSRHGELPHEAREQKRLGQPRTALPETDTAL